jgi:radical SAM superfamily enzyme YgiQ (UPF0313 family)
MKTLIIALNSKFIHSALAPWYLKACCGNECGEIMILEATINESIEKVLGLVYLEKPDIAAFSCYIWNISHVLKIAENLKKLLPETRIVLGGPEAGYDPEELMEQSPFIDFVLSGEGEISFPRLLDCIMKDIGEGCSPNNCEYEKVPGLFFRFGGGAALSLPSEQVRDLDMVPSPFTEEMLSSLDGRIVYFESSRGCPFSCSYCLSSIEKGVRYFSMERVKKDLRLFIDRGVRQVKFVDRTFNCNAERAKQIFSFLIDTAKKGSGTYAAVPEQQTNFHFEASADLFDDEMLDLLSGAPEGLIQFEIGIQSVNRRTLDEVNRKTDVDRAFNNIARLRALKSIHIHLDLIAGLPFEDLNSFKRSFNSVYHLKPHQLQLGFLKMLKGTAIREKAAQYRYVYRNYPPYEVLSNEYLSFDDLLELKGVEDMVEKYFNSARFACTTDYLVSRCFDTPYEFYLNLFWYFINHSKYERTVPARELYSLLTYYVKSFFGPEIQQEVNELLKLDFLSSDSSGRLPEGLERIQSPGMKESCFEFLKREENIQRYLPRFTGISAKQIYKQVHFEQFSHDVSAADPCKVLAREAAVLLFDYGSKSRITGLFQFYKIDLE